MAEYISKDTALHEINHWWTYVLMCDEEPSLNNTIKELPPADVVARKDYEVVCIKCNNLENRIEAQKQNLARVRESYNIVDKEIDELHSKIDTAISEIEEERHIHYTNVSAVIDSVLEILKRNIG